MSPDHQSPPTTDKLRHEIDRGQTGDKVDWPDPAAAPLGTDAEASGNAPTAHELKLDRAATPERTPRKTSWGALLVNEHGIGTLSFRAKGIPTFWVWGHCG